MGGRCRLRLGVKRGRAVRGGRSRLRLGVKRGLAVREGRSRLRLRVKRGKEIVINLRGSGWLPNMD